jgi:hypothetical protein
MSNTTTTPSPAASQAFVNGFSPARVPAARSPLGIARI